MGVQIWKLPLLLYLLAIAAATSASAEDWDCYGPQPGHPTAAERSAFVADISHLALAAEVAHGIPAPAIAAMAINESGYGFTHTALNANNLFGFKSTSMQGPGGRAVFVLACQPAWDENNKYVAFASRADAVDYVASRLAESPYYRADTDAFRLAMANGARRDAAIRAWLQGIADPYNFDPVKYVHDLNRQMNDPIAPADTLNLVRNLYALGPPPAATAQAVPASTSGQSSAQWPALSPLGGAAEAAAMEWLTAVDEDGIPRLTAARYMATSCDAPDPGWGAAHLGFESYKGFLVARCPYSRTHPADAGLKRPKTTLLAVVWLLDADASTVARWVGDACQTLASTKPAVCGRLVAGMILSQNGAQFPVAGHVLETQGEAGCPKEDPDPKNRCPMDYLIYLPFRDGVTVKMAVDGPERRRVSFSDVAAADAGAIQTLAALASVGNFGRIANSSRNGQSDQQWLANNRNGYLDALRSGTYKDLLVTARNYCRETDKQGARVRDCGL
ncbi:MAG: glucosaminidase domain-containing protein [Sphingomonas bacterium]